MSAARSYLQDSGIYEKEGTELLHEPEVVDNLEGKVIKRTDVHTNSCILTTTWCANLSQTKS